MVDSVQELARRFLPYFRYRRWADHHGYVLRDDTPRELWDVVDSVTADVHDDEWRHRFIYEALKVIAASECPEEACIEATVEDDELPRWLGSNPIRGEYINTAVRDTTGVPDAADFDIYEVIRIGYILERNDVYWRVLGYLRRISGGCAI
jgi:hypothetical protein